MTLPQPHSSHPVIFDTDFDNFEHDVLLASREHPVLVDFWAEWCSPCLFLDPILKAVIPQYQREILLAKVEVDEGENMKLAGQYKVRGFPTVILFNHGIEVSRFSSAQPKTFVQQFIDLHCDFHSA